MLAFLAPCMRDCRAHAGQGILNANAKFCHSGRVGAASGISAHSASHLTLPVRAGHAGDVHAAKHMRVCQYAENGIFVWHAVLRCQARCYRGMLGCVERENCQDQVHCLTK